MKRTGFLLIFLTAFAFAQDLKPATPTNAGQFLGTWQASFQGKPFMTVKLSAESNKIIGAVTHANVEVNKNGELTSATAEDGDDPITDARVSGSILRITTKSTDGSDEAMQWVVKLLGPNEADVTMGGVPADVPQPKPWKLKRVVKH